MNSGQGILNTLREGSIVAYPTESFYALGVDATNPRAIRQLFRVKHREKNKPVALIAGSIKQVEKFFVMSKAERSLARRHWPGALTVLLRPKKFIAGTTLAPTSPYPSLGRRGQIKIGVRIPAHPQARALALRLGPPITATSANISGQPPTKSAAKIKRDFPGILIMPGRCGSQTKPSTVAEIMNNKIVIHRQGAVYV